MTARLVDGIAIAAKIREGLKTRVAALTKAKCQPGLAVVMVGSDPESAMYVRNKIRACHEIGIRSSLFDFASAADPGSVISCIQSLNADPSIHGILVQLPLPQRFPISEVLQTISAEKDVDGFHL